MHNENVELKIPLKFTFLKCWYSNDFSHVINCLWLNLAVIWPMSLLFQSICTIKMTVFYVVFFFFAQEFFFSFIDN